MYSSKLILLSVLCFYAGYAEAITPIQRLEVKFEYPDKNHTRDLQTLCTCSKIPSDLGLNPSHYEIMPNCPKASPHSGAPSCPKVLALLNKLTLINQGLRQELNRLTRDLKSVSVEVNQVKVDVNQAVELVGQIPGGNSSSGGGSGGATIKQISNPITLIIQKLFGFRFSAGCVFPNCPDKVESTTQISKLAPKD
ncbi:uncharacterized protein LOC126739060 isoform X2 [Anthonomus grandis grandis]|uniref:uncharacterized protein LOC126739060 isoform X2 n=1 Tax=Anthonomus grandis grandis TaxID=2921223 RepID=UPI0021661085|nr:uncharacterized protein LOC126739060 isoform X2 [Anthonomus grandis grandis]